MATRDYVKRGKTPRKAPRKSPKKQPVSRPFPIKWAILAVILTAGFAYGLFLLSKGDAPAPQKPAEKTVEVKKTEPKKDKNALPPKPKEKWSYVEELENKKVEVEAPEPQAPGRPYLMQCGAYRSIEQADSRKAMIAFQGLESQIRTTQGEKGTWYRVILGPYTHKRKAERDRNMLRRAGIEPCAIWYWD